MMFYVAVFVLGLVLLGGLYWWRSQSRASSVEALMVIARDIGTVVASDPTIGDSELVDVADGVLVLRVDDDTLRLPLAELLRVHLAYDAGQRAWHYGQLVSEARRKVQEAG